MMKGCTRVAFRAGSCHGCTTGGKGRLVSLCSRVTLGRVRLLKLRGCSGVFEGHVCLGIVCRSCVCTASCRATCGRVAVDSVYGPSGLGADTY